MTARQPADLLARMAIGVTRSISAGDIHDLVHTLDARTTPSAIELQAAGNGTTDDTAALQAAVNAAYAAGRPLRIPAGQYRVTGTITLPGAVAGTEGAGLCVVGDGEATEIRHDFNGRLFSCSATLPTFMVFQNFKVVSTGAKSSTSHVFYFAGGLAKAVFRDLRIGGTTAANGPAGLFDCAPSSTVDTVAFEHCYLEGIRYTGYGIAKGSSIWWYGGRVIGQDHVWGTGIHLYGDNGGVFLNALDIINCNVGMKVTKDNATSNREIFITQSCFDSCHVGLWLTDSSYCEIEGVWAASCNEANIHCDLTYAGILMVSGGTVFNAGVYNEGGSKYGAVINGGALVSFDGVVFRSNVGTALACPQAGKPAVGVVTNCTITGNGTGISAGGQMHLNSNTFYANTTNLVENAADLRITGNRGLNPGGLTAAPATPASGSTYTYTGNWPIDAYVWGGTVSAIFVNGTKVYGTTNGVVRLEKGETVRIDYTSAPTWIWMRR